MVNDRTRTATIRCGGLALAPHGGAIKQPSGAAMSEANGGLDRTHVGSNGPLYREILVALLGVPTIIPTIR